eukprot:COSAG05_NODE_1367_length_5061_cov_5.459291_3_plen_58_part_00
MLQVNVMMMKAESANRSEGSDRTTHDSEKVALRESLRCHTGKIPDTSSVVVSVSKTR